MREAGESHSSRHLAARIDHTEITVIADDTGLGRHEPLKAAAAALPTAAGPLPPCQWHADRVSSRATWTRQIRYRDSVEWAQYAYTVHRMRAYASAYMCLRRISVGAQLSILPKPPGCWLICFRTPCGAGSGVSACSLGATLDAASPALCVPSSAVPQNCTSVVDVISRCRQLLTDNDKSGSRVDRVGDASSAIALGIVRLQGSAMLAKPLCLILANVQAMLVSPSSWLYAYCCTAVEWRTDKQTWCGG